MERVNSIMTTNNLPLLFLLFAATLKTMEKIDRMKKRLREKINVNVSNPSILDGEVSE